MTERDVLIALAKRYAPPECVFVTHVGSGTGANYAGAVDGLALNLWPSRGLTLTGFEVKISRSDFAREKKAPAKAERIAQYCNEWYLAAPKDVVPLAELPANWGLIEVSPALQTTIKKRAKTLAPVELTRPFVAALARRLTEQHTDQVVQEAGRAARHDQELQALRGQIGRLEEQLRNERRAMEILSEQVRAFEQTTDLNILGAVRLDTLPKLGASVRLVASLLRREEVRGEVSAELGRLAVDFGRLAREAQDLRAEWRALAAFVQREAAHDAAQAEAGSP